MPSFRDAVANYKAGQARAVPVNPPESVRVLETQTAPEVETPKAPAAAPVSVAAAVSAPVVQPLPETETVKRSRRTKAEMEAARAAAAAQGPSTPDSGSVGASVQAAPPVSGDRPQTTEELVAELNRRGYTVELRTCPF